MKLEEVKTCVAGIGHPHILVIGDLMIDEYLWGDVERISPEAPVQVVDVKREAYALGGAGNVVHNLVSLGATVYIASVIGEGANARLVKGELGKLGVNIDGLLEDPSRLTIKKTRILALSQQVLRIDREDRRPIEAYWEQKIVAYVAANIEKLEGIIISDYLKGVVTKSIIKQVVDLGQKHNKPVIVDPKGLDFSKYTGATIITPNLKEASYASQIELDSEPKVVKAAEKLLQSLKLQAILITRGKDGLTLVEQNNPARHIPTRAREVYDVAGAGDTVVAAMGLGICSGLDFYQSASLANLAAGIVVGKVGVATVTKDEILYYAEEEEHTSHHKIKTPLELSNIANNYRINGKKTVFTFGCFEVLQVGHIKFLQKARRLGDALIIGLNDTSYISSPKYPFISTQEWTHIISALDCVDFVVVFDGENPQELINLIKPNVVVRGKGFHQADALDWEEIRNYGGEIKELEVTRQNSTRA
jgi:D-beta-D-heptose 7-phosphate kinase/D-beta-D-heptose 1-phosphate adenosyltransferase